MFKVSEIFPEVFDDMSSQSSFCLQELQTPPSQPTSGVFTVIQPMFKVTEILHEVFDDLRKFSLTFECFLSHLMSGVFAVMEPLFSRNETLHEILHDLHV